MVVLINPISGIQYNRYGFRKGIIMIPDYIKNEFIISREKIFKASQLYINLLTSKIQRRGMR